MNPKLNPIVEIATAVEWREKVAILITWDISFKSTLGKDTSP